MFLLKVNPPKDIVLTKRAVLCQIARTFELVGFAAAFLIRAKIVMQRLWQQGQEWDQELPLPAREEWVRFFQEMGNLNHVTFEKSLTPVDAIGVPTLCIFSDASKEAFGACAYTRWQTESNKCDTRLISAKSRVKSSPTETTDHTPPRATSSSTGHQAISVYSRRVATVIWESRIFLTQQHCIVVDSQSSERVQAVCVRPSCKDSKQLWPVSVEIRAFRFKCSWRCLSWRTGTTTDWQMETGTRILKSIRLFITRPRQSEGQ